MDTITRALTDAAMSVEEAIYLPAAKRKAALRGLLDAAQARKVGEFTIEPVEFTDDQWQRLERSISMALASANAED